MSFFFSILIIVLSTFAYADETCEIQPILSAEADLTKISCHLESKLRKPNQSFCKNCNIDQNILNPKFMQAKALDEVELTLTKTILQPLTDSFKIGNNKDFNVQRCTHSNLEEKIKSIPGCKNVPSEFIQQFRSNLAKEMSNFISSKNEGKDEFSFLKRTNQENSCNISDADVLRIKTQDSERNIDTEALKDLLSISLHSNSSLELTTLSYSKLNDKTKSLIKHPLLRNILLNSHDLISNFLKKNPKATNKEIIKWLYKKEHLQSLSESTNSLCDNSFKKIAELICNPEFDKGNISIPSYSEFEHDIPENLKNHTTALYCSQFQPDSINISDLSSIGLKNDQLNIASLKKEDLQNSFYKDEISKEKEELCATQKIPCSDNKSPQCQLAQDVKKATENNVSSFDKETIKKLRDILGPDVQADESTRKTLIASGIMTEKDFSQIPPSTNVVATPSPIDPSKEREIMGTSPVKTIVPVNQNIAGANIAPYSGFNGSSSYSNTTQEETREVYKERSPVLPPSTAEYIKQMSSMNRDLLDRLVKEKGAKDKYSNDEIKEQLARMSKERDLPLPLDQQAQFFDHEWSDIAPKVMPLVPDDLKAKDGVGRRVASISAPLTGKALQQKRYDEQRNSALEQFGKGADNSAPITDSSAVTMSVNNELLLKKVRLDVPDEKLEKLNLSMILDQKLGTDKEGKKLKGLIDNKQSFMLDIEGKVAFMVEYSEAKKGFDIKALKNNLPPEVFEKIKIQISDFLSKNERKHEYSALKEELKN